MNKNLLLYLLLTLLVALSSATQRRGITANQQPPKGFELLPSHKRSLVTNGEITVILGLKQRNVDKLEEIFWRVSDPKHSEYGNHMSFNAVVDLVAPTKETVDTVVNWMTANGIEREKIALVESKDFLNVDMTVEQAEMLLQAPQTAYVHKRSGSVSVRMEDGFLLPEEVDGLIDVISDMHIVRNAPRLIELATPPQTRKFNFQDGNNVVQPLSEPSVTKRAPAASDAPVIMTTYMYQGAFLLTNVLVFCPGSGNNPTISNAGVASCGSVRMTGWKITFNNQVNSANSLVGMPRYACIPCSADPTCAKIKNPNNALCFSDSVKGIPIYTPYQISVVSMWSDGSNSSASSPTAVMSGGEDVVPTVVSRTMSIPSGTTVQQSSNNQSVAEFDENFLQSDVVAYFNQYGLTFTPSQLTVQGTNDPTDPGAGEGILDIVAIMGTARNCKTVYWIEQNGQSFLPWITNVLSTSSAPLVHSVSWGLSESSSSYYNGRTNTEFIKAGVRGISIIVSSGDDGVQKSISTSPKFDPDFPASSPYVTSVGATQLAPASTDASCYTGSGANVTYTCSVTEIVASTGTGSSIASGGGFSNQFPIPGYQSTVVASYLNSLSGDVKKLFNNTGRAYPDISGLGHAVRIFHNGTETLEDGTSAAAPFVAAIVTLLNDIRLSQGKPPLGFINPLLYSWDATFFNDITVGDNKCIPYGCTSIGFSAAKGWDPVTGLGSPIFSKMSAAVSASDFNEPTYFPALAASLSGSATTSGASVVAISSVLVLAVCALFVSM